MTCHQQKRTLRAHTQAKAGYGREEPHMNHGRRVVTGLATPSALMGALALSALLSCLATDALAQSRFRFEQTPGRLSRDVIPEQVDLHIRLAPAQPRFEGQARIHLKLLRPQKALTLHASGLDAAPDGPAPQLLDAQGRQITLKRTVDTEAMTWTLSSPATAAKDPGQLPLPAGRYQLNLSWQGSVSASGEGLFRAGGKASPMLATQLQAIHARQVFPAFDEPAFRARYRVSVQAPRGLQVLSNMPRVREEPAGDAHTVHHFDNSPPMPSYLVAVAVGDFDVLRANSGRLPLAIYTEKGKSALAAFAMGVTQQVMPYFDDYFGQAFALPKLDQLAVPSVRMGAMEDWGLVSYIEGAFLHDPQRQGVAHRRFVYDLIAHELSHHGLATS
jgi:aminopeptidase N